MLAYTYRISDLFTSRLGEPSVAFLPLYFLPAPCFCTYIRVSVQQAAGCGTSSDSVNGEAVKANEQNFLTISVSSRNSYTHLTTLLCSAECSM